MKDIYKLSGRNVDANYISIQQSDPAHTLALAQARETMEYAVKLSLRVQELAAKMLGPRPMEVIDPAAKPPLGAFPALASTAIHTSNVMASAMDDIIRMEAEFGTERN